ncbi:MAG: prepilin-type N-terminal cleavage/methylation domain-containing protein [Planctomycetota bacterium]
MTLLLKVPEPEDTRLKLRSAFTLLELLLTLAVFAMIAAVAMPSLSFLMLDRGTARAANQVAIEMSRNRIEAMRSGRIYQMQLALGGRVIQSQPMTTYADSVESDQMLAGGSAFLTGADQAIVALPTEEVSSAETIELYVDTTVESVEVESSVRSQMTLNDQVVAADMSVDVQDADAISNEWSMPIYFYPDGSTSTSRVRIQATDRTTYQITLRGLTGEPTVEMVPPSS